MTAGQYLAVSLTHCHRNTNFLPNACCFLRHFVVIVGVLFAMRQALANDTFACPKAVPDGDLVRSGSVVWTKKTGKVRYGERMTWIANKNGIDFREDAENLTPDRKTVLIWFQDYEKYEFYVKCTFPDEYAILLAPVSRSVKKCELQINKVGRERIYSDIACE